MNVSPSVGSLSLSNDRTDHCVESHVSSLSNRNRRQLPLGQGIERDRAGTKERPMNDYKGKDTPILKPEETIDG